MPLRFLCIAVVFRFVVSLPFCSLVRLVLFRPEFSYRPGLGPVSEDTTTTTTTPLTHGSGGPPNRPLPPTPDDDDQAGDRTLIMKRVSTQSYISYSAYSLFSSDDFTLVSFSILFKLRSVIFFVRCCLSFIEMIFAVKFSSFISYFNSGSCTNCN